MEAETIKYKSKMAAVLLAQAWTERINIKRDYFILAKKANEQYRLQIESATLISKTWRRYHAQKTYRQTRYRSSIIYSVRLISYSCISNRARIIKIQKFYRGSRQRARYHRMVMVEMKKREAKFYNEKAVRIQALFRGHYTRKNIVDFYDRRNYLRSIINVVRFRFVLKVETYV